jgi:hypothetical protein
VKRLSRVAIVALTLSVGCVPDTVSSPNVTLSLIAASDGEEVSARPCDVGDCKLRGGEDALMIEASLAGVGVEAAKEVTAPTVTILADGEPLDGPTMTSIGGDPLVFKSKPFLAPPRKVSKLTVRVVVAAGYQFSRDDLSVSTPRVTLKKSCLVDDESDGGTPCSRGMGRASFTYTAWVPDGTKATVRSLVDGVPSGSLVEQTLTERFGAPAAAVFSLLVPDHGTRWRVEVDSQGLPTKVADIELVEPEKPSLTLLGCTSTPDAGAMEVSTCKRGASLSLQVEAPRGSHSTEATVRSLVDGVYTPGIISVNLDIRSGSHQVGVTEAVLPERGRKVEYRASVGGVLADAKTVELAP